VSLLFFCDVNVNYSLSTVWRVTILFSSLDRLEYNENDMAHDRGNIEHDR
jgi:hypothetical protein